MYILYGSSMLYNLQDNGKYISWKHMVRVYEANWDKDTQTTSLRVLPKVKYDHIFFSWMRVDLAAQI